MIEGVKIEVSSTELKTHLQERANHHKGRADFYDGQARHLTKGLESLEIEDEDESQTYSNSGQQDPRTSMRASKKTHLDRQAFFQFMADHVISDEVYRLTENDFLRLEMVSKYL